MTLAPRVVLVHRRTEYDELLARHGSHGQAAFFLGTRSQDIADVQARHAALVEAMRKVSAGIPVTWRRGDVEREDLSRFLFAPEDIVVVVGQDGLVPNVAKYLDRQPVLGIDPEPGRNPGVLVRHAPAEAKELLRAIATGDATTANLTMVAASTDDGQRLVALNEVFVGHPSHQTARYTVSLADGAMEQQASSGIVVSTGTGRTGGAPRSGGSGRAPSRCRARPTRGWRGSPGRHGSHPSPAVGSPRGSWTAPVWRSPCSPTASWCSATGSRTTTCSWAGGSACRWDWPTGGCG